LVSDFQSIDLYSPWPELASDTRTSRCQPLIRCIYLPTPYPDRFLHSFANGTSSITEWFALQHEYAHLRLNSTPIKEQARLYLGRIYDSLEELFRIPEDQWNEATEKSWANFLTMHTHLSDVYKRIYLAEELLATAFTFSTAEIIFRTKTRTEISDFEAYLVNSFRNQFVDFEALYYGLKGAFRLADNQHEKFLLILAWFGIFLQPIDVEADAASKDRCKTLVDHVRSMKNCTQLLDWLERQICDPSFIQDWQATLLQSMRYSQNSENMRLLGELSMANRLLIKKEVSFEDVVNLIREIPNQYSSWPHSGGTLLPQVFLYPKKRGNTQYIVPFNEAGNYNKYLPLLFLESIQQQLNTQSGIHCPFLLDDTEGDCACVPQPLLKQGIKRLARWAKEGRFGPGKWTDVVYPPRKKVRKTHFLATTEQ
jgi:hypothetical protein